MKRLPSTHSAVSVYGYDLPPDFIHRKYGGKYAWMGALCHQDATNTLNAAFGSNFLPTQVLSTRWNVAFWQSFYGSGDLMLSPVLYGGSNWGRWYIK